MKKSKPALSGLTIRLVAQVKVHVLKLSNFIFEKYRMKFRGDLSMKILDMTNGRETYRVEMKQSPLWETALGIAVVTYPEIHHTLVRSGEEWDKLKATLDSELIEQLQYVQTNNTWFTLLQLLHQREFADVGEYVAFVKELPAEELLFQALPYLGAGLEAQRNRAARGDQQAVEEMIDASRGHLFFPGYVRFLAQVDMEELRVHLVDVMARWYAAVVLPQEAEIRRVLKRDYEAKQAMLAKMEPEAFVEWATGGIKYLPEPSVTRVVLIPQAVYRPWSISAVLPFTKVYYYPVSDESLEMELNPYRPHSHLVQMYKALGDENRLRIVKLLSEGDRSLQELTDSLDLAKSTIHHHLSLLRAAKLVKTDDTKYVLQRSSLLLADKLLQQYLEG
jgi:hypothetical protein